RSARRRRYDRRKGALASVAAFRCALPRCRHNEIQGDRPHSHPLLRVGQSGRIGDERLAPAGAARGRAMRPLVACLFVTVFVVSTRAETNDLRLWYTQPAAKWEEALPIGSGRLGAMVFGGARDERIQFNEDTLWTGKPRDYVRKGARDHLEEI